jgi:hypothetical protein
MKKISQWLVPIFVLVLMVAGCGKKSGLEGKVVDAKGQPISGLKVIAKQHGQIIKGYEQFETTTDSDGTFKFKNLYPSSEYVIFIWNKDWNTDAKAQVIAGPEGETILLKGPIQIRFAVNVEGSPIDPQINKPRFVVSNDGVIIDSGTGLEWFVGPDEGATWDKAKAWCAGLSVDGGGWRMPQQAELETLYINGFGERNMAPVFKTTGWWVWSGELYGSDSSPKPMAGGFNFDSGEGYGRSRYSGSGRAFAVRSRK